MPVLPNYYNQNVKNISIILVEEIFWKSLSFSSELKIKIILEYVRKIIYLLYINIIIASMTVNPL